MATVKLTPVSGKVVGTHTNFPVLITPSAHTNIGTLTLAEAQSVRIYTDSSKTVEIAREVVSADEIWCKVPSFSSSTELYFDWNGVDSDYAHTDPYGRNAVWSDYEVVYHGGLSSLALVDSTGNTTTKYSANTPTEITGKVGNAFSPNGAWWSSSVNPNTAIGTGDFTAQFWNNFSSNTARRSIMYAGRNGTFNDAFQMIVYESAIGNQNTVNARAGTSGEVENRGTAVNGTWKMSHFSRTGTTGNHYIDGTSIYSASNAEWGVQIGGSVSPILTIAANYTSGVAPVVAGAIDELRLRGSLLSANWITTEYNNQSNNTSFWDVTAVGGATPRGAILLTW